MYFIQIRFYFLIIFSFFLSNYIILFFCISSFIHQIGINSNLKVLLNSYKFVKSSKAFIV